MWLRAAVLAVALTSLTACGSGDEASGESDLVVSGASSLTAAFTAYGKQFERDGGKVRFSFAGSDDLAAQIRQGVKPDVFAAANSALPDSLHEEGLVVKPIAFATNRLVLAVPAKDARVESLADLERRGVTIAIGSEGVPIGDYTREVLGRLGPARAKAVLANVRSNEPDVKGIVGKLSQGAVDAGFVYVTDVAASDGLTAIPLPDRLQPEVVYKAALVYGAGHPRRAAAFLLGLLHGRGAAALKQAGFGPPPPLS